VWDALSEERAGLLFIFAAGLRQRSHIYRLWTPAAILLLEFDYNFCDAHYCVFFRLSPIALCHDLLKYRCDYFEYIVQGQTACIRSLNWLTWYLKVVPRGREALISPTVAGQASATEYGWGCCWCCVLLRSTAAKDSPGVVWLTVVIFDSLLRLSLSHLVPGVGAASTVGGMRFLSVHHLAVTACRYQCCIALPGHSSCRRSLPRHIQRGGCLQFAQISESCWQL
jgi:hypothetical protein